MPRRNIECGTLLYEAAERICSCIIASERGISWICPASEARLVCHRVSKCFPENCPGLRVSSRQPARPEEHVEAENRCLRECYKALFSAASEKSGRGSPDRIGSLVSRRPWENPVALFWLCAETGLSPRS